ncbi:MAG: hypothetical protein QNI92_13265 [Desulfobacterales bacterium]|nr:hypothetical protein [Desulfobacterales bacterium]
MTDDKAFYTATMARVYASQGYYDRAADIYRYLLEKAPDRQDLQKALAEVELEIKKNQPTLPPNLSLLLDKWVKLLIRYKRLQKLKKLQGQL